MKITAIAAVGRNWELGRKNDLIWNIPEDMQHFRTTTEFHGVVMGRKTFDSIGGPLPNRRNYIVSTRNSGSGGIFMGDVNHVGSIEVAIENASKSFVDHLFVIGGGELYRHVIEQALVQRIILTRIDDEAPDADVYFPNLDRISAYREIDSYPLTANASVHTYLRTDIL